MRLHSQSIKKLINTIFSGDPITGDFDTEKKQTVKLIAIQKELKEKISSFKNLKIERRFETTYGHWRKIALRFIYKSREKSYGWRNEDTIDIYFENNQLYVESWNISAPLSDPDQIVQFFKGVDQKRDERQKNVQKTKKVKDLKEKAVLSRIKILSKELNFHYFITKYKIKLKLSVRLGDKHMIEIDIPYNRFQEILQELGYCIESIISLYDQGIKFKIKGNNRDYYSWTPPGK
ncbi:hypothetical protein MHK_003062 [Candidatus Magnetomorum sp. HK-1]|nr:hypothetical protein MHK_003062 [Candidatus Magnetomorum sp. HK-1]